MTELQFKVLYDVMYTESDPHGIFFYMTQAPWWVDEDFASMLDDVYLNDISGAKIVSRLVSRYCERNDLKVLTVEDKQRLANTILRLYKPQWEQLYEAYTAEYNPIHNYDMREEKTGENGETRSSTGTSSESKSTSFGQTQSIAYSVWGFNTSDKARPSDNTSINNGGSDTTSGSGQNSENRELSGNDHYVMTRSGNIGVTTAQQMIKATFELWKNTNYFSQIFADIDKILTIPYYDLCRI